MSEHAGKHFPRPTAETRPYWDGCRQGLLRLQRVLEAPQQATTTFDGRSVVNLSSNNYLGLTTHPLLKARAIKAIEDFGVGSGSVRTIAGTMSIHAELERRLALFKRTEAAGVFQSGFTANAGTVQSLLTRDDVVVSDELNHASIIDGCRLSRATIKVFPHKDVDAARKIFQALPTGQRTLQMPLCADLVEMGRRYVHGQQDQFTHPFGQATRLCRQRRIGGIGVQEGGRQQGAVVPGLGP